jgi:hypothetical protein
VLCLHYLSTDLNVSFYADSSRRGGLYHPPKLLASRSGLTTTQPLDPYSQDGALIFSFPVLRPSIFFCTSCALSRAIRRFLALLPLTGSCLVPLYNSNRYLPTLSCLFARWCVFHRARRRKSAKSVSDSWFRFCWQ